ncbi:unnamed protein product [Candida verbasci]|uniref:Major facilitator superfamily (MFS) profile domain-containing protein n=1 Tax=Candida verbasci TaxID=1227364 RepID=A0A9W4XFP1_9ASCO|nr:unnamed protein product [Candida verbasci]
MSNSTPPSEIDPLLRLNHTSSRSDADLNNLQNNNNIHSPPFNSIDRPTNDLEEAVNDVYEAIIENDLDDDIGNEDVQWLREQRTLNKSLHWLKRPSVLMIATIIFFTSFGSSSAESSRQIITLKLACNYLGSDKCTKETAQVLMSDLQLGYSLSGAIIMLIASGKVAPLSDLYGRKSFIILVMSFVLIGKILKFLIMYKFNELKFWPMIFGEIILNLGGGLIGLMSLANCYISDVVEPHERIYSLGISIASMFVGVSIGPLVGNLIISWTNKISTLIKIGKSEFLTLKFELIIVFINLFICIFILPESRSEKARQKSRRLSRSSSLTNLQELNKYPKCPKYKKYLDQLNFLKPLKLLIIPKVLVPPQNHYRLNRDRFALIILVSIDCLMTTLAISFGEIFVLYGIYKFNWNQNDLGRYMAITCSSKAIVLILLSPVINHKIFQKFIGFKVFKKQFDMVDYSMCLTGLICEVTGFIGYSLSPTTLIFFIFTLFCGFGSLIGPSINSSIVKFYPESKIGELFGATSLLRNIFALIAPILYLSIYKISLSKFHKPNFVFWVAGFVLSICTIMLIITKRVLKLNSKEERLMVASRSNSFSSINYNKSFTQTIPTPNLQHKNSFSEIQRKNSFVYKDRNNSPKKSSS